jgi:hypothetical protein
MEGMLDGEEDANSFNSVGISLYMTGARLGGAAGLVALIGEGTGDEEEDGDC